MSTKSGVDAFSGDSIENADLTKPDRADKSASQPNGIYLRSENLGSNKQAGYLSDTLLYFKGDQMTDEFTQSAIDHLGSIMAKRKVKAAALAKTFQPCVVPLSLSEASAFGVSEMNGFRDKKGVQYYDLDGLRCNGDGSLGRPTRDWRYLNPRGTGMGMLKSAVKKMALDIAHENVMKLL